MLPDIAQGIDSVADKIYSSMKSAAIEGGRILLKCRGKVEDLADKNKVAIHDEYAAQALAKTIVDDVVQELFLARLFQVCPQVRINVEEETPLKYLFQGNQHFLTSHCDPCDGTLSYLEGKDEFATGYAISDAENNFTHTVVCIPTRGRVFAASPQKHCIFNLSNEQNPDFTLEDGSSSKIVFAKRILSEKGEKMLLSAGLKLGKTGSAHTGIIDVATGKAAAFIYGLSKPHDSFIPYAFATACGAQVYDATGKVLTGRDIVVQCENGFPVFERVPSVCYFKDADVKSVILEILSDKSNLHPSYVNSIA